MSSDFDFSDGLGVDVALSHEDLFPGAVDGETDDGSTVFGPSPPVLSFQHMIRLSSEQLPPSRLPQARPLSSLICGVPRMIIKGPGHAQLGKATEASKEDANGSAPPRAENPPVERYMWQPTRNYRKPWSASQTDEFFDALSQFGTNFSMVAVLFPGLSRDDIVHKFKIERKKNSERVQAALDANSKKPIDEKKFALCFEECKKQKAVPQRELNAEEEAHLQAIDFEVGAASATSMEPAGPSADLSPAASRQLNVEASSLHNVTDFPQDEFSFSATMEEADETWFNPPAVAPRNQEPPSPAARNSKKKNTQRTPSKAVLNETIRAVKHEPAADSSRKRPRDTESPSKAVASIEAPPSALPSTLAAPWTESPAPADFGIVMDEDASIFPTGNHGDVDVDAAFGDILASDGGAQFPHSSSFASDVEATSNLEASSAHDEFDATFSDNDELF